VNEILSVFLGMVELVLLARVVLSWTASPTSGNPAVQFIRGVTEPLLAPIRSILPPMAGFDFSPMVAFVLLRLLQNLLS
jgi:YggT family protein